MNRTRTNDRSARTRNGAAVPGRNGKRFGTSPPSRFGGPNRDRGQGRRSAPQGEFALPETVTPALPAVADFAELDMPGELLAALGAQGVTVPFPIQAATLPNSLAGRDVLGRGRTGSGKTPRGIHVDSLDLVVNVDPPTDHKDYLHRGGRTARAGESGSVVTLVTPSQRRAMTRLMATAGIVPQTTQVRAGAEALQRITGAQAPSGVPVVITAPVVERPKRRAASRGRRRPASATRLAGALQSPADAAA